MRVLYCTPLGESMREEFADELAKAIKGGRGGECAYLLPSAHLLNTVRRRLRETGPTGYEQPNLLSFDDLVREITAAAGYPNTLMDRMTQELLVAGMLDELSRGGGLPYFSAIAAFPGYVSTVTSLLAEVKRTAVSPEEFAGAAGASGREDKDGEVAVIYARYQELLAERRLADLEEMYFLAARALRSGVALPYKEIFVSEFYLLTPLQLELVRELSRGAALSVNVIYETARPEVYRAVEPTYSALVGMGFAPRFVAARRRTAADLEHVRRALFAPRPAQTAAAEGITVIGCPSREKEMAVAAARIKALLLAGDHRPEEIAIVVRDPGAWSRLRETADEFGISVSLPEDESLSDQPVARLLANALAARTANGARHEVLNLIKSPLVAEALAIDADAVEQAALGRLVRSWRDWFAVFRDEAAPESLASSHRGFDRLARWVTSLPRRATCGRYAASLAGFLEELNTPATMGRAYLGGQLTLTAVRGALLAREKCVETLEGMEAGFTAAGQKARLLDSAEFLRFFRQALAGQTIRLAAYDERAVQVVSPAGVRGVTFRAVFVLGLTGGAFPARDRENWLYDDRERALLGGSGGIYLPTTASRRAEEELFFAVAAALAEERLVLSSHEDAVTTASPFVAEVTRLFAPGAVTTEVYNVGQLFPDNYDEVYAPRELAGRALLDRYGKACADGRTKAAAEFVFGSVTDADLARRVAAEEERGREPGRYGGMTGQAAGAPPVFSITALEDYAGCPFAYFAKHRLGLREWEEREEEAGFDVIGNIYHETLAAFLRAHRGATLCPDRAVELQAELAAILEKVCAAMVRDGRVAATRTWDYRRRRLGEVLRRWLEHEIAEQNAPGLAFRPQYLEWGFGLAADGLMDPASVSEPLELNDGERRVRVVGKVDRVDAAGGKLAVVDYKRKFAPRFRDLADGRDLQAALYIMAVERFLCPPGGVVAGGGYYSVENRRKEGGMWRAEVAGDIGHRAAKEAGNLDAGAWEAVQAAVRKAAGDYSEGIRAGVFPVRPAAQCPPFCVGRTVCRYRKENAAGSENDG